MPPLIVAVPSTALVLPEVVAGGDGEVDALRRAVAATLRSVGGLAVVVAVDPAVPAGWAALAPPEGVVHLGGLSLPALRAERLVDRVLGSIPAHPGPDLGVLAVLAERSGADAVQLLGLGSQVVAEELHAAATALLELDPALVLVAGDLAAGHGSKPPRPDVGEEASRSFDERVVSALADPLRLGTLRALADPVAARGLPALELAATLAAQQGQHTVEAAHTVVGGVGGVAARWA